MAKYEYKRVVRFLLVGVSNAVLHFSILNASFFFLHQSKIGASIIATIFAMSYSFILNRNFVFKKRSDKLSSQAIPFIVVTVSGMLIVHNLIYLMMVWLLEHNGIGVTMFIENISGHLLSADFVDINLSTVVGATVAMIWNYNGYRLFVFHGKKGVLDEENQ